MSKRLVSISALLLMLLLCSILSAPSAAADYSKLGVKQGDISYYTFTAASIAPGTTMSLYVKNATGTYVGLNWTIFNPGGSMNDTMVVMVNASSGAGFPLFYSLVAANLRPGDRIYDFLGAPTFNGTAQMSIAGYTRTLNVLNLTDGSQYYRGWWDQSTGLMVKTSLDLGGGPIEVVLTSTTAFGIFSDLVVMLLIGGGIAAVVVVAAAVVIHHRRK
jgi:hypothetical protein